MHQARQYRRRRRATIPPRRIRPASFSPCGGRNARKPDDPIAKAKGFAIKNADLRGFGRDWAIRRGRTKQVGGQAKAKDKGRQNRASNAKARTAKAGAKLPSLENASWFSHPGPLADFFWILQLAKQRNFRDTLTQNAKSAT